MPLQPVTHYEDPAYPTLDALAWARRAFLRRIGLAAIAAAFGPVAGCDLAGGAASGNSTNGGAGDVTTDPQNGGPQEPVRLAGVPPPPKWPGPKGAIVGGGPISVTYADGEKGWIAVSVVFDPANARLEQRLISLETELAVMVRQRFSTESRAGLADSARRDTIEAGLLEDFRFLTESDEIQSVVFAVLTDNAGRGAASQRPAPSAPAPAPSPASAPAPKRLPRAGTTCPIHPSGCDASDNKPPGS